MRDRRGNGNLGPAFENVERRGTEFTFAADEFAFAEAALDDGPAIEFKKCSRHALENGILQEILGFESLRVSTGSDRCSDNTFVRERARGAGDHALTARDARGIAHW